MGGRRAVICAALILAACTDSGGETRTVGQGDAYTAVVRWEIEQHPPVLNEDGSMTLPVIYVASGLGQAIDPGAQASVVAATKDDAVVRFADTREDALDMGQEEEPVKDDGVMLLVGELPEAERLVKLDVVRYRSKTEQTSYVLTIKADPSGAHVTQVEEAQS